MFTDTLPTSKHMKTIRLHIPDMNSAHCQLTVSNVVTSPEGKIKSVQPAQLAFDLNDNILPETVLAAITKAGYHIANEN